MKSILEASFILSCFGILSSVRRTFAAVFRDEATTAAASVASASVAPAFDTYNWWAWQIINYISRPKCMSLSREIERDGERDRKRERQRESRLAVTAAYRIGSSLKMKLIIT